MTGWLQTARNLARTINATYGPRTAHREAAKVMLLLTAFCAELFIFALMLGEPR